MMRIPPFLEGGRDGENSDTEVKSRRVRLSNT